MVYQINICQCCDFSKPISDLFLNICALYHTYWNILHTIYTFKIYAPQKKYARKKNLAKTLHCIYLQWTSLLVMLASYGTYYMTPVHTCTHLYFSKLDIFKGNGSTYFHRIILSYIHYAQIF